MKLIAEKTGIGNRVIFFQSNPKSIGYTSDTDLYQKLGIGIYHSKKRSKINIVLYGYDWKKFWIEKVKNPLGKFYGYKYRVFGYLCSFGYTKTIVFDGNVSEYENNKNLWSLL